MKCPLQKVAFLFPISQCYLWRLLLLVKREHITQLLNYDLLFKLSESLLNRDLDLRWFPGRKLHNQFSWTEFAHQSCNSITTCEKYWFNKGSRNKRLDQISGIDQQSKLRSRKKNNYCTHLNRNQIESDLSVPGIQGRHENAFYKSFEMSPHFKSVR